MLFLPPFFPTVNLLFAINAKIKSNQSHATIFILHLRMSVQKF